MKKTAFAIVVACTTATLAAQAPTPQGAAASATGNWAIDGTPWSIVLKQEGSTVTGKVVQGVQEFEIYEGKVEGSTVSFKAKPPTNDRVITFVGKIGADEIAFTRTTVVNPGGAAGGAALMGAGGPPEFKARRSVPDTDVWSGTARNLPNPNNPGMPPPPSRPVTVGIRMMPDPHWRWRGGSKDLPTRVITQNNQTIPLNSFTVNGDQLAFEFSQNAENVVKCMLSRQAEGPFVGMCQAETGNLRLALTLTPPKEAGKRP